MCRAWLQRGKAKISACFFVLPDLGGGVKYLPFLDGCPLEKLGFIGSPERYQLFFFFFDLDTSVGAKLYIGTLAPSTQPDLMTTQKQHP